MDVPKLSEGELERVLSGEEPEKPIFQILGVKEISGGETPRLRMLISDGKHCNSYAMLATQLNSLYHEGKLTENTIARIDKYIVSVVNKSDSGKRVLVILELTVLMKGGDVGARIGDPKTLSDVAIKANGTAAGAAAANSAPERAPLKSANNNNSSNNAANHKSNVVNNTNNNSSSMLNSTLNTGLTHPIASLSPYQNKWVIRARVTAKTPMRTWSNAKGEGKLFSMDLMDESGEIRATAFKEQADKFFTEIEPGQVYYISKCQLKPANKQYTTLKNDYEMTFTSETVVQQCDDSDDNSTIPDIKYELVPIAQIAEMEPKATIDTIGICKDVGELQMFTARTTNRELKKRELVLVDQSNASVNLTLWGDEAENFNGDGRSNPVILVKGARVNEFNGGKSLALGSGSLIKINPDIPECHRLKGWFDNGGGAGITQFISAATGAGTGMKTDWLTFYEAQKQNLGHGDKADYFQCKATIHIIKTQNSFYKACPQSECNKKIIDQDNGQFRCERCNANFPNFKYRLLLQMSIADWASNRWVTCFNETAEQILGRSAQEVGDALENNTESAESVFSKANFESYIFKLRTKLETYGDTQRNKIIIQGISPINYREYNKYLINNLKELTGMGKN